MKFPKPKKSPPLKSPQRPMNQGLVDLAKTYQESTPALLGSDIDAVRDFLINVIAPKVTALNNGLQDGVEVLRLAMGEEPQAGQYMHTLSVMLNQALQVRMANFIAGLADLTKSEYDRFMELALEKKQDTKTTDKQLLAMRDLIIGLGSDAKTPTGKLAEKPVNPRLALRREMAIQNRINDSKERKK